MPLPKLIILEGADNCGKSTLGRTIAKHCGGVYLHATGKGRLPMAMKEYHSNLLDIAEENIRLDHTVVIDRHWPSEYIYGNIFRPLTKDHEYDCDEMHKRILSLGGIYVYVSSKSAVTRHAANKDPEHPYADVAYQNVVDSYVEWYSRMLQREDCLDRMSHYNLETNGQNIDSYIHTLDLWHNINPS